MAGVSPQVPAAGQLQLPPPTRLQLAVPEAPSYPQPPAMGGATDAPPFITSSNNDSTRTPYHPFERLPINVPVLLEENGDTVRAEVAVGMAATGAPTRPASSHVTTAPSTPDGPWTAHASTQASYGATVGPLPFMRDGRHAAGAQPALAVGEDTRESRVSPAADTPTILTPAQAAAQSAARTPKPASSTAAARSVSARCTPNSAGTSIRRSSSFSDLVARHARRISDSTSTTAKHAIEAITPSVLPWWTWPAMPFAAGLISSKRTEAFGRVHVRIAQAVDLVGATGSAAANSFFSSRKAGTCDPYVEVAVGQHVVQSRATRVLKHTNNPTWDEAFHFPLLSSYATVRATVWHDGGGMAGKRPLGEVILPISLFADEQVHDIWVQLRPCGAAPGEKGIRDIVRATDRAFGTELRAADGTKGAARVLTHADDGAGSAGSQPMLNPKIREDAVGAGAPESDAGPTAIPSAVQASSLSHSPSSFAAASAADNVAGAGALRQALGSDLTGPGLDPHPTTIIGAHVSGRIGEEDAHLDATHSDVTFINRQMDRLLGARDAWDAARGMGLGAVTAGVRAVAALGFHNWATSAEEGQPAAPLQVESVADAPLQHNVAHQEPGEASSEKRVRSPGGCVARYRDGICDAVHVQPSVPRRVPHQHGHHPRSTMVPAPVANPDVHQHAARSLLDDSSSESSSDAETEISEVDDVAQLQSPVEHHARRPSLEERHDMQFRRQATIAVDAGGIDGALQQHHTAHGVPHRHPVRHGPALASAAGASAPGPVPPQQPPIHVSNALVHDYGLGRIRLQVQLTYDPLAEFWSHLLHVEQAPPKVRAPYSAPLLAHNLIRVYNTICEPLWTFVMAVVDVFLWRDTRQSLLVLIFIIAWSQWSPLLLVYGHFVLIRRIIVEFVRWNLQEAQRRVRNRLVTPAPAKVPIASSAAMVATAQGVGHRPGSAAERAAHAAAGDAGGPAGGPAASASAERTQHVPAQSVIAPPGAGLDSRSSIRKASAWRQMQTIGNMISSWLLVRIHDTGSSNRSFESRRWSQRQARHEARRRWLHDIPGPPHKHSEEESLDIGPHVIVSKQRGRMTLTAVGDQLSEISAKVGPSPPDAAMISQRQGLTGAVRGIAGSMWRGVADAATGVVATGAQVITTAPLLPRSLLPPSSSRRTNDEGSILRPLKLVLPPTTVEAFLNSNFLVHDPIIARPLLLKNGAEAKSERGAGTGAAAKSSSGKSRRRRRVTITTDACLPWGSTSTAAPSSTTAAQSWADTVPEDPLPSRSQLRSKVNGGTSGPAWWRRIKRAFTGRRYQRQLDHYGDVDAIGIGDDDDEGKNGNPNRGAPAAHVDIMLDAEGREHAVQQGLTAANVDSNGDATTTVSATSRWGYFLASLTDRFGPGGNTKSLQAIQNVAEDVADFFQALSHLFDWSSMTVTEVMLGALCVSALISACVRQRYLLLAPAIGLLLIRTGPAQFLVDLVQGLVSFLFGSLTNMRPSNREAGAARTDLRRRTGIYDAEATTAARESSLSSTLALKTGDRASWLARHDVVADVVSAPIKIAAEHDVEESDDGMD